MSTLKTINIEHLDAISPSIVVNAAGGIQVGGALTATTGTFSGNVSVAGVLSYEDVANIDSVGIITANAGVDISNTIVPNNDSTIRYDNDTFIVDVDANNVRGSSAFKLDVDTVNAVTIDDNRRIGIGTDSPGTLLELKGQSSKEATVTFNRQPVQSTNDGVIGELMFENATDSVALLSVKRESAADDAYFQFATQATSGGLTEKLRITSDGEVTKPLNPRFHVNRSGDQTSYNGGNVNTTRIEYNNVVYDIGSNFVTGGGNIGRFVAPVAGLYLFHASAVSDGAAYSQSWFQINGVRSAGSDWVRGGNTYSNTVQNSTQLYCAVGDLVSFHPYNNSSGMTIGASIHHTWFKGCLLG